MSIGTVREKLPFYHKENDDSHIEQSNTAAAVMAMNKCIEATKANEGIAFDTAAITTYYGDESERRKKITELQQSLTPGSALFITSSERGGRREEIFTVQRGNRTGQSTTVFIKHIQGGEVTRVTAFQEISDIDGLHKQVLIQSSPEKICGFHQVEIDGCTPVKDALEGAKATQEIEAIVEVSKSESLDHIIEKSETEERDRLQQRFKRRGRISALASAALNFHHFYRDQRRLIPH